MYCKNTSKIVFLLASAAALFLNGSVVYAAESQETIYSYDDMEADLQEISRRYPRLTELSALCQTFDGRNVYCLRVGPENADKQILVTGSIHAREYITTELVMKQLDDYLTHINSDDVYKNIKYQDLTQDTALYFVPMINPDGVTISQFGTAGLKNASSKAKVYSIYEMDGVIEIDDYLRRWKSNAEGVDINRQFEAQWEQYNDRVGHPSSDHYKGTRPVSVPEAKALVELTEKNEFDRTISYHTQGEVIYWYFGQSGDLYETSKAFAERMSRVTGYRLDANYQNLDPAGYKDWALIKKGIPSITIEVGTDTSPVPHGQFNTIYNKNKTVLEEAILSID